MLGCDGCLSQGDPTIVWRDQVVQVNLEISSPQERHGARKQGDVLPDAPAQADLVNGMLFADLLADPKNHLTDRIVKASTDERLGNSGIKIIQDGSKNRSRSDFTSFDTEFIRSIFTRICHGFELDGCLSFVVGNLADPDECRNGIK